MSNEITNEKLFEFMTGMYEDLSSKIGGIESKIDGMESKIGGIESKIDGMESKIAGMESKIDRIEKEVKKINTKIDHEITPKMNALFDGYKQNSEKLDRIEEKVSRHEEIILRKIK